MTLIDSVSTPILTQPQPVEPLFHSSIGKLPTQNSTLRSNSLMNRSLNRLANCLLLAGVEQMPAKDVTYFVVSFRVMRMLPQSLLLAMFPYGISSEQSSLTVADVIHLCQSVDVNIHQEFQAFLSQSDSILSRKKSSVAFRKNGTLSRKTSGGLVGAESSGLSWQKRFNSFVGNEESDTFSSKDEDLSSSMSSTVSSVSGPSLENDQSEEPKGPLKGFLDTLWHEIPTSQDVPELMKEKAVQVAIPRNLVRFLLSSFQQTLRTTVWDTLELVRPGSSITLTKDSDPELTASSLFKTFRLSIPPMQPILSVSSLILHETIDIYFLTDLGNKQSLSDNSKSKRRLRDEAVRSTCLKWITSSLNRISSHGSIKAKRGNSQIDSFMSLLLEFTLMKSEAEWQYHGMRPYTIQLDRYAVLPMKSPAQVVQSSAPQRTSVAPIAREEANHPEIVTQVSKTNLESNSSSQTAMRENLRTKQPFRFSWMEPCTVPLESIPDPANLSSSRAQVPHYKMWLRRSWTVEYTSST